ncbi:MAG TPA: hypothetical protein VNV43_00140 [Candidatus Acidoferrales bacterium]|nr:hypothetical protein [Candidatus Acidoferrales bacterium]
MQTGASYKAWHVTSIYPVCHERQKFGLSEMAFQFQWRAQSQKQFAVEESHHFGFARAGAGTSWTVLSGKKHFHQRVERGLSANGREFTRGVLFASMSHARRSHTWRRSHTNDYRERYSLATSPGTNVPGP